MPILGSMIKKLSLPRQPTTEYVCTPKIEIYYVHTIYMHVSHFYKPIVSYRIKNDSYLSWSAIVYYRHFTILQGFFTVLPHELERTEI